MSRTSRTRQRLNCAIESLESRRLLSGGALDTSFNNKHGTDSIIFDGESISGRGMAVQADGKIVDVGVGSTGDLQGDIALVRFNTNGVADITFGPKHTGKVLAHVGAAGVKDIPYAVAIQSDGKIVVVGRENNLDYEMFIARFTSNGSLDTSFSGDGIVELHNLSSITGTDTTAAAVAIQKDGKILVAGHELEGLFGVNDNLVMARLTSSGKLDNNFGDGGITNLDMGENEDATAVTVDYTGTPASNSDYGKIIVVGHQTSDWDLDIREGGDFSKDTYKIVIARYTTNGNLDTNFAGDGREVTSAGSTAKSVDAEAVTIETGGKIVIAGNQGTNIASTDHDFFLARFNLNGSQDKTFGSSGKTVTNFGGDDYGQSLLIGGFGQQLIAGGTSSGKFALSAYSLDGKLFNNFGTNGLVTTKADNKVSQVTISLAPNHTLVAAGGVNFNTARYLDISPNISFASSDDAATEGTITKHLGKKIVHISDPATMVVTRDEALPIATRVFFNVGGTANIPNLVNNKAKKSDYTLTGMTVSTSPTNAKTAFVDIPAGQTSVTVTFNAVDDSIAEPAETASFTLASNSNYSIGTPSSQVMSIIDNDGPVVTAKTFVSTADAYVKDGTSANSNFGTASQLVVKKSSTSGSTRLSYLKFDLSSISSASNVQLQLFGNLNNANQANVETDLYAVADTSWTETDITYNNKPAAGASVLAKIIVADTTPQLYTFDVTTYVKAQLAAGHKVISLLLKNPSTSDPAVLFNARESSSNKPTLVVT